MFFFKRDGVTYNFFSKWCHLKPKSLEDCPKQYLIMVSGILIGVWTIKLEYKREKSWKCHVTPSRMANQLELGSRNFDGWFSLKYILFKLFSLIWPTGPLQSLSHDVHLSVCIRHGMLFFQGLWLALRSHEWFPGLSLFHGRSTSHSAPCRAVRGLSV